MSLNTFSIPVCCVMCCYFREKVHIDHFWVLKVKREALLDRTAWREKRPTTL